MSEIAADLALAQELANLAKSLPINLKYRLPIRVIDDDGVVILKDADDVEVMRMVMANFEQLVG